MWPTVSCPVYSLQSFCITLVCSNTCEPPSSTAILCLRPFSTALTCVRRGKCAQRWEGSVCRAALCWECVRYLNWRVSPTLCRPMSHNKRTHFYYLFPRVRVRGPQQQRERGPDNILAEEERRPPGRFATSRYSPTLMPTHTPASKEAKKRH